jgi:hypothetical protein
MEERACSVILERYVHFVQEKEKVRPAEAINERNTSN